MTDDPRSAERLERLRYGFSVIPLNQALGIEIVNANEGNAWMRLPYRADLVGNPETGVLHGGPITALLDTCCGAAVFTRLKRVTPIATIDLRIDYLKPATPERAVTAHAECYKMTTNVAFVRCIAYHDDENAPIASAAGAFMIQNRGT